MFERSFEPRVYGLPPGADFGAELVRGVLERYEGLPPQALARLTILVNTRRMQRRLKALFSDGAPRLLPRIGLLTDIDEFVPAADLPPPVSRLRRQLELAALVGKLIDIEPDLAPRAAIADLAESLAALMDEMQGEDVPLSRILELDISDMSGHWSRSLKFLSIVHAYLDAQKGQRIDTEDRRRRAADILFESWRREPPDDPIIVAGSTGSRKVTAKIMAAVAKLPLGAVVLPGFDFAMPPTMLAALADEDRTWVSVEDHPQYRFARFLKEVGLIPERVARWSDSDERASRNQLISLSLRPAPVTDDWLIEGPRLGDLCERTKDMTLIEADNPKDEALAIAIALREAAELGKSAALITPDRTLGRRVTAALQRWDIIPDDSAGRPLALSAPGRFLREVARLIEQGGGAAETIALLKHPLSHSGGGARGTHLRLTRELELYVRRRALTAISAGAVKQFATTRSEEELSWCQWLEGWITLIARPPAPRLSALLMHHIDSAEALAGGGEGPGAIWEESAGRDALGVVERFRAEADFDVEMTFSDYRRLLENALNAESTRGFENTRPDIMIWGTLEARVQGAERVILGGLNEGIWPERLAADPWLNRTLRRQAGLLLPDRQIGLAAHDYQQAVAAPEVILSRSKRDAESETVPSRWLSRLSNLLEGLEEQGGAKALREMKRRGAKYLSSATQLEQPRVRVKPAPRPSPAPPATVRPSELAVTDIQTLIRDPYAIYARRILRLRKLDPLVPQPDARLRGQVFHRIVERAFAIDADFTDPVAAAHRFRDIAGSELAVLPWPGVAANWFGHLDSIVDQLIEDEVRRRYGLTPIALEAKGRVDVPDAGVSIIGKADRIDRREDGRLVIYDYKTGKPPSLEQVKHFDRQLPIEAVMAELGGFEGVSAGIVSHVAHIGLGRTPETREHALVESDQVDLRTVTIQRELAELLAAFGTDGKGYPARRAMEKVRYDGDYDHLARFGEWDDTSTPETTRLP